MQRATRLARPRDRHTAALGPQDRRTDAARPVSPALAGQLAALEAARLAPSAHNSQPWRFQPARDGLLVGWDAGRELPHGDPRRRYLMTGLGAAAESLALGVVAAGLRGQVEYYPRPGERVAARVRLAWGPAAAADRALAAAIPLRQTTRLPFWDEPLPAGALARLAAAADRHGCQLVAVEGRQVGLLAELVAEGTARNFADPAVYREFHGWLRSARDPRAGRDGLPLQALGLGRGAALLAPFLLDPARMRRLERVGLHRAAARTQGRLARRCPAFCLLVSPSDEPAALFGGGRAMLRVWLEATALGLRLHPMTAAMDHDPTRAALAATFGVPADASMVLCFRLGRGPTGPRAPRLPLAELLVPGDPLPPTR
jgi:nitroreductase